MLEGKDIVLNRFKREAAELIVQTMNEVKPKDIFELADMLGDLGAFSLVSFDPETDDIIVTNVSDLVRQLEEREAATV